MFMIFYIYWLMLRMALEDCKLAWSHIIGIIVLAWFDPLMVEVFNYGLFNEYGLEGIIYWIKVLSNYKVLLYYVKVNMWRYSYGYKVILYKVLW